MKKIITLLTLLFVVLASGSNVQAQNAAKIRLHIDRPSVTSSDDNAWFDGNITEKAETIVEEVLPSMVKTAIDQAGLEDHIEVVVDDRAADYHADQNRRMERSGDYNRSDAMAPSSGGRSTYNVYFRSTAVIKVGTVRQWDLSILLGKGSGEATRVANYGSFAFMGASLVNQQSQSILAAYKERQATVSAGKWSYSVDGSKFGNILNFLSIRGNRIEYQAVDKKAMSAPRQAIMQAMQMMAVSIVKSLDEKYVKVTGKIRASMPSLKTSFAGNNRYTLNVRGSAKDLQAIVATRQIQIQVPVHTPGEKPEDVTGWILPKQSNGTKITILLQEFDGKTGQLVSSPLPKGTEIDQNTLSERLMSMIRTDIED